MIDEDHDLYIVYDESKLQKSESKSKSKSKSKHKSNLNMRKNKYATGRIQY